MGAFFPTPVEIFHPVLTYVSKDILKFRLI